MTTRTRRWRALGGVVGPGAFVATWAVLGADRPGYSPVEDPISRLAAVGAPSRAAMTAGFAAFGTGVALYATEVGRVLPGGTARAAAVTASATLAVAALPLDGPAGDDAHAWAAGVAYAALAAAPLAGARSLRADGRWAAAVASVVTGLVSAAALTASVVASQRTGLWQRIGLTVGDAWIAATAGWSFVSARAARRSPNR